MTDSLSFSSIDHGYYSGIEEPLTAVFRSSREFESFWRRHAANNNPAPACPDVEFESSLVVCVFLGTKDSGGYGVEIKSVEETEEHVAVTYDTSNPPPGAMTTCALTQPFHIVTALKRDKGFVFKEVVEKVEAEDLLPPYTVILEDKSRMDDIVALIEQLDTVSGVDALRALGMVIVNFHHERTSKTEAVKILEGLEGVSCVEEG
uniref:PrcB C-terminal domain-containing protein n=1 Tax=Odontella aurita TaxID=265563 RepID=A0A7S4I2C8_9STRA